MPVKDPGVSRLSATPPLLIKPTKRSTYCQSRRLLAGGTRFVWGNIGRNSATGERRKSARQSYFRQQTGICPAAADLVGYGQAFDQMAASSQAVIDRGKPVQIGIPLLCLRIKPAPRVGIYGS